ncbi:Methylamine utilization protein MauG [Nymphon striatum]|nr:Methylamine utilization protein MauG [Nymphon striatum]
MRIICLSSEFQEMHPSLFNLGAKEFVTMFHDGRLQADGTKKSGLRTPLDDDMTVGFSGVLSAQSMFPVLSPDEMAGHYTENDVAKAVRRGVITGEGGAWDIISKRVIAIDEYQQRFIDFDSEIAAGKPVDFTDISDAIAAFIAFEWRSDNSPFDQYLKGSVTFDRETATGMDLFYGKAQCGTCHSGVFQTDHQFHAMGVPQIGPGKAARFERHSQDIGRMRVTGKMEDAYAFRTPSLRNKVTLRLQKRSKIMTERKRYFLILNLLKDDWIALDDANEVNSISNVVLKHDIVLDEKEIDNLVIFLNALTDSESAEGRLGIPQTVPSGFDVDH